MIDLPPDPMVRRVNQLTTTFLDTLALLLIAGGTGLALWVQVNPPSGIIAAGLFVLIFSNVAQRRAVPKLPKSTERDDEDDLPGPADPGNLHVMGR